MSASGSSQRSDSNTPVFLRWSGVLAVLALALSYLFFIRSFFPFRSFAFAFQLHFVLMAAASLIDQLLSPRLDSQRFRVRAGELVIYRALGVIGFMRLLQRIGWAAALRDKRVFDGTRRTLAGYERATRQSENNHTWLFCAVLVPIAWAVGHGWWDAVLYLGSMNVIFHVYPVMLQRTQRARLHGLMQRRERRA